MIKILQVMSSLSVGGGVQNVVYNYYTHMHTEDFQTDFIVHGDAIGGLEGVFEKMGCHIYHVPPKKKSFFQNFRALKKILKTGRYDIVHCHQHYHGWLVLYLAKKYRVPMRIIHSHASTLPAKNKLLDFLKKIEKSILTPICKACATDYMACSEHAAKWLFNQQIVKGKPVIILKNGIHANQYAYRAEKNDKIRQALHIPQDAFLIGNIGRFTRQKNHDFLIDIFKSVCDKNKKALLLLIGDGALQESIEAKADALGIRDHILFLGIRTDIPDLLSAMDVFCLPSLMEGLPLVTVEAQAACLPMVCSEAVPKECDFTGDVIFLPLSDSPEKWADTLLSCKRDPEKQAAYTEAIRRGGYDIEREAAILENFYKKSS